MNRRDIAVHFGPHLSRASGMRLDPGVEPDRLVKTPCCFCGQQCGIQLRVKGNEVIGFEPWLDFPFNQGKLCPKGIKRYLQGSHPDRLLRAYERDPSAPGGSGRCGVSSPPRTWPVDAPKACGRRAMISHGGDSWPEARDGWVVRRDGHAALGVPALGVGLRPALGQGRSFIMRG